MNISLKKSVWRSFRESEKEIDTQLEWNDRKFIFCYIFLTKNVVQLHLKCYHIFGSPLETWMRFRSPFGTYFRSNLDDFESNKDYVCHQHVTFHSIFVRLVYNFLCLLSKNGLQNRESFHLLELLYLSTPNGLV